jgi:hypothetical protein
MAVHHGKNGKVKIGSDAVANITKWSINESVEVADTTGMGDAAQTHVAGIPGWSGSMEGNYNPVDTGQEAIDIGASISVGLYSDGDATGKRYFTGTATITSIATDGDMKSAVKFTANFQGNGALGKQIVS